MRPSTRRNFLWTAPLVVLAGALAFRVLGPPEILSAIQRPLFDFLAPLSLGALHRADYADRAEEAALALAGLAMLLLFARARAGWAAFVFVVAAAAAAVFVWRMAVTYGLFFDATYPVAALALTFVVGAFMPLFGGSGGDRSKLIRALEDNVAPAAVAAMIRAPELLNPSGQTRTMSYLVCGIRRYAQIAESFSDEPEAFRRLTRRTIAALSDAVVKYKGTVDRITPGGLTAFFNAPLEDPEHAIHACECAFAMTRALEAINHTLEQERRSDGTPFPPVEIGIGVNSGPGVAGDFGTDARPRYTVAGSAALLAREIEEIGAKYGPAIFASEATRQLAERNFAFLEVDTVIAANAIAPVRIYALLGNPLLRASPKFRALSTFHDHIFQEYRAGQWAKTRALIEQCRTLSGASQQLYDLYLARIAYYETHPPGENWNGAVRPPVV